MLEQIASIANTNFIRELQSSVSLLLPAPHKWRQPCLAARSARHANPAPAADTQGQFFIGLHYNGAQLW
jgi:hypothetical protein